MPSNDQWGVIHSEADERWLFWGNRSGKTQTLVNDCDMFCRGIHPVRSKHRPPPVKVRYCGTQWRDAVEGVILQKFREVVIRGELLGGSWSKAWREKDHKLYYANGSVIQFKSGEEDINTYGGTDLDAVYQDEHLPESIYRENKARLADRRGYFCSGMTPEMGIVWEDDHTQNPPDGIVVEHWDGSTYGNPYLNPEGVRQFAASLKDENMRRVKLFGERIALTGRVVPQFNAEVSVVPDRELKSTAYRVFVIDFHKKIPAFAGWWAWEPQDDGTVLLVMYRAMNKKQTVPEWQKDIRLKSAGENIQLWIGDEPDGGDTADFRGHKSAINEFREGPDALPIRQARKTKGLYNQAVFTMWDWFNPDPVSHKTKIQIFESCDHPVDMVDGKYHGSIAWELNRWRFKKEQKADEEQMRERIAEVNDHYIAGLRYVINAQPTSLDTEDTSKPTIVLPKRRGSRYTGVV